MSTRTFAQAVFLGSVGILALSTNLSLASPAVTSWDVASEFTDQTNGAAGVWSYGEEATLNGAFTSLTVPYSANSGNVMGWTNASSYPLVAHNVNQTAYTATGGGGPVTIAPHGLQFHPGAACEYAVARFTAPAPGTYKISGQFFGLDDNGLKTTTDVHISVNGNPPIFNGNVDLNLASAHYSSFTVTSVALAGGDHVDFQVGCGTNGAYNYDSAGLNAVIEAKLKRHK